MKKKEAAAAEPVKKRQAQPIPVETDHERGDLAEAWRATDRANRRLRETLEHFDAAFFAFDVDWILVYVNQRASDLWRAPLMNRIGERLWEVTPGWDESVFGKKILAAVAGEGPIRFDHWHRRLNIWMDVRVYQAEDGVSLFIEDISDRRRLEFEQSFLAKASAVLAGSLDLETTLQNVAALAVQHIADFCVVDSIGDAGRVAQTVTAHIDPGQFERLAAFRERFPFDHDADFGPGLAFRTGRALLYETIDEDTRARMQGEDGRFDEFLELGFRSVIVAPMISRAIVQGVISLVSTTPGHFTTADLPLAEELARRAGVAIDNAWLYRNAQTAAAAKEQFLLAVAHELRTPITSIGGFARLIQRETNGNNNPERLMRYARRLSDASSRLSVLIEDVLDVSRMSSNQMLLQLQEYDLAALTRDTIERIDEQRLDAHIRITYDGPEMGCLLTGDSNRIGQVLSNVIDNAIKYSPQGGEITVRLTQATGAYEVSVQDHGIGLPPGVGDVIFETFGRAINAQQANVPGLGIGLSIARSIVERHDGAIWAESDGEGHGATVRFRLPAQRLD